ncbi:hypothetical protein ACVNP1_15450 [Staphylococcus aureus]
MSESESSNCTFTKCLIRNNAICGACLNHSK